LNNITIAIDAMGGDHGLDVVIPACAGAMRKNPDLRLLLVLRLLFSLLFM
jgi:glycerol-3-phosphate acyltransferase PlsX